jgi:putative hydrolase of the HAD superfamily
LIRAVLFDLDDTLFEQGSWLAGAWWAVAAAAGKAGADPAAVHRALTAVAAEGSDRGRIIDRALVRAGAPDVPVDPLLAAFRAHRPRLLSAWPGVRDALAELRWELPVGLVTDGDPAIQRAKLAALALTDAFDVVVFSDELGRSMRKPHPAPFVAALDGLGLPAAAVVHVGDRPDKDVAGARTVGMRAVRVRTGEYAGVPDRPRPWASVADVVEAIGLVRTVAADASLEGEHA